MSPETSLPGPEVSILFANWNGRELLRQAILSVRQKTAGVVYEIIVVDDGSTDGSVEMIRSEFPEIHLLVNETNLGFARANNVGITIAQGKYVFLLNTDTLFEHDAIKVCADFLDANPEVAICGCWLKSVDGSSQVSFGNFPSFHQALVDAFFLNDLFPNAHLPKRGAFPDASMTAPVEVDYVTGAAIMIRKSLIDEIGLFDELYRMYSEETDLCYRVRHTARKKVYFLPGAKVIHLGGMSLRNMRKYQVQLMYSSYHKFLKKYHGSLYSLATRILYAWQYFVKMIVRFVRYIVSSGPGRQEKRKHLYLAWYVVRYSLVPDERFSGQ